MVCSRVGCVTLSHKKNKMDSVDDGTLFTPALRAECCFRTPRVTLSDYPSTEVQAFLLEPRSAEEMRRIFSLFADMNGDDLSNLSREELLDFVGGGKNPVWMPTTPGDLKAGMKKPRALAERLEEVYEGTSIDGLMSALESAVSVFSNPVSPSSEDPLVLMTSEIPKLHGALVASLQLTKALHGSIVENKEEYEYGMLAMLKNLQNSLSGLHSVIGSFDREASPLQEFGNDVSTVMSGIGRCVLSIQLSLGLEDDSETEPLAKKRKLVDRVSEVELSLKTQVLERMTLLAKEVISLKDLVGSLGRPRVSFEDDNPMMGNDPNGPDASTEQLIEAIGEAMGKIGVLEETMAGLKDYPSEDDRSKKSSSFKIAGFDFSDFETSKLFLASAGAYGKRSGYFYDCFSMGNYCVRSASNDRLADRAAANRANVSSNIHDLSVELSFDMDRPPQFGFTREIQRGRTAKDPTYVLPHVRCMEDLYDPDVHNQKAVLRTFEAGHGFIAGYHATLLLKARLDHRAQPIYDVAKAMNDLTLNFMRDLRSQVEFFYRRITLDTVGSTTEEAWSLVSEMLSAVLAEIYTARVELFSADVFEDDEEPYKAAMALTNTFRAHAKMNEIIKIGFAKHPCVVPALSLHLFGRKASIQAILVLEEKIGELGKKVKAYESLQAVSRSEFDAKFNSLKIMIEKLGRDIKVVPKKA